MDSITEFTALAELKLLNKIREELKVFVAELTPELDLQLLAKQVRSYFAYADKPVHLYHGGREVVRTFWYCLLHPEFQGAPNLRCRRLVLCTSLQCNAPVTRTWQPDTRLSAVYFRDSIRSRPLRFASYSIITISRYQNLGKKQA